MTLPQILEVAIGLVLVYYVMGSVVSAITQVVVDSLETRGVSLQRYLTLLFGDEGYTNVVNLPQIKAFAPIKYKNWTGIFTAAMERKKIEKIPVQVLVNAFMDQFGLVEWTNLSRDTIEKLISRLPDSGGNSAVTTWFQQGITNISDLRERVTEYITGLMEQAETTFAANSRSIMVILSLALTVISGIDSFQLAKELWNNAGLRAIAIETANITANENDKSTAATASVDLSMLSIHIGWLAKDYPSSASAFDWIGFLVLKVFGLGVTAACVSQGSAFWYGLLKKLD